MKLLYFDDFRLGVLKGNAVVDVSDVVKDVPSLVPGDVINTVIARFSAYRSALTEAVERGTGIPLGQVKVRPPVPRPSAIHCMAVNYMENGTRKEPAPINAFLKTANCVIGDGDTMIFPDVPATVFEGEAELAAVIGRRADNVPAANALSYIFGYTNFIDGSARGVPAFYQMKARATFAPIGPYIVTADEIANPQNLQVQLFANGRLMQDYNTNDMAHDIAHCLAWVSSIQPLEPGDLLCFGTNHRGLFPFQDGDKIEIETQGLGRLHISVRDDLKRTWPRETRHAREEKGLSAVPPQVTGKYAQNQS